MRTDQDLERAIRLWVAEGSDRLPDRELDIALDQIAITKQRHAGWLARRINLMNGSTLKFGLAAAAIIAVALLGVRFLPSMVGGPPDPTPDPTAIPTPTPVTLASGSFIAPAAGDAVIDIEATRSGDDVSGSMEGTQGGLEFTVDLQCTRTTEAGLVYIGGTVTASAHSEMVEGTYIAIMFEPGTPIGAVLWFDDVPSTSDSCPAFLETIPEDHPAGTLAPIEGDLVLNP